MSEVSSESDPASSSEEGEIKDEEPVEDSLEYESDSSYHAPLTGDKGPNTHWVHGENIEITVNM